MTETDNLLFTTMTHNPQPLHLDIEAAKASEFGKILVNGTFTFSLMVGLSVGDTTLGTLVANLGYDKLVMPKPVFIGDTLHAETEVIGLKESKSRPGADSRIATCSTDHTDTRRSRSSALVVDGARSPGSWSADVGIAPAACHPAPVQAWAEP